MEAHEMMDRWAATVKALLGVEAAARAAVAAWCASADPTRIDCRMADLETAVHGLDSARKGD